MHVVMNTNVTPSPATGVGQYIQQLVPALQQVAPDLQLTLLVDEQQPDLLALPTPSRIGLPFRPEKSFRHIPYQPNVQRQLKRLQAEVYHVPNTYPLFYTQLPSVITIHDLQEFFIPKYSFMRAMYRKIVGLISARIASAVITDSAHSKKTIVNKLGIPEAKVHAIPLGCNRQFLQTPSEPIVTPPYILSVGQLQPGKNYVRLLEAYAQANTHGNKMVIVGSKGWGHGRVFQRVQQLGLEDRITFLHDVAIHDLVSLYNHATLCVIPSLYEGFGFPALEAMACGTPVIAADNSSLPEVLDDAGSYFDPYSVTDIATALEEVVEQADLRENMQGRGLTRVQNFTWQKTAESTLAVYTHVLKQSDTKI